MNGGLQLSGLGMVLAALLAWAYVPQPQSVATAPDLEALIPQHFGEWAMVGGAALPMSLVPQQELGEQTLNQPYDQTVMRTYRNGRGDEIMLAVAFGAQQRQEIKIHRPELCYVSQGFRVLSRTQDSIAYDGGGIPLIRLVTSNDRWLEPVSYWIRIGDSFVRNGWEMRWELLKEGMAGRLPDGLMVRVSSAAALNTVELGTEFDRHEAFVNDLMLALQEQGEFLLGELHPLSDEADRLPLRGKS